MEDMDRTTCYEFFRFASKVDLFIKVVLLNQVYMFNGIAPAGIGQLINPYNLIKQAATFIELLPHKLQSFLSGPLKAIDFRIC